MRTWRTSVVAGGGVILLAAILAVTAAPPAGAQSSQRPLETVVVNDASRRVPVQLPGPLAVTPPFWQGTPFVATRVVLNSDGFERCEEVFTASPGTAVLLKTVTGSFNVPPDSSGGMRTAFTLPDGTEHRAEVPMPPTAGALQVSGINDRFAGSLVLDGFPVIQAQACLRGANSAGTLTFIGFAVPLP